MKLRTFLMISVLILTGTLCRPSVTCAQDKGELLPDINPQDIEIRGQFKARFPGLKRQPILGFSPNSQAYQIDPNRQPFMESSDQAVSRLAISNLSRPAPPAYPKLDYARKINTVARLGFGSYTSPEANIWAAYPINKHAYIGGDLDLSTSEGHLDDRPSSFRFLTGHLEYGTKINDQTTLRLHGGVQNDFNYAARFGDAGSNASIARIEYQGYSGGAELSHLKNDIAGWKLKADVRSFNTDFTEAALGGKVNEVVYGGSFSNRWALGHPGETIALKAGGRGGNYDPEALDSQMWGTLHGGVAYERMFNYNTHLHAEAQAYYTSDVNEQKVYPGGLLTVNHSFGNRLKISGRVQGKPHLNTVENLHEQNRFLGYNSSLIHDYTVEVTGQASIKYYRGSKLHAGVTYSNTKNEAFFLPKSLSPRVPPQPTGSLMDFYDVNYMDATNFKLFAGITHQLLPERFWISAEAYVQHPELKNGAKVPFEPSWGVDASVAYRPFDRLKIKGWANYVPERHTNITNDEKVDGFFLVGGQADVDITSNIGAYLKLVNVLSEKYQLWKGYRERPFQVYGGLSIKF